jgi:hypothetical protein
MENEFVPYQQSFDLKELGFDEPCLMCWNDFGKTSINRFQLHNKIDEWCQNYIEAPLYQQAFRWLLALANKDEHFSNKWSISYNEDYYSLFLGGCNMGVFKTELECLKNLIQIIKEK